MRKVLTIVLIMAMGAMTLCSCKGRSEDGGQSSLTINGAGASFPYPIYSQWAFKYEKLTGMKLNYQSIGSGGGIRQIKAGTVDFGASDAPLEVQELEETGLVQFPMIIGGVVPILNVEGADAGKIRLSPSVLVDAFLGKIKRWNDPAIARENPELTLPDQAITIVYRSDGSGTTWIFTNYLSKVSSAWKEKVGNGKAVSWPVGIGAKGNEGVAAYVQRVSGSLGYVEYAYALENHLTHASLRNREGRYVQPTSASFQAAAANADWKNAPGYYMVLTDQQGDESWPITGASFILIYKEQKDADKGRAMLKFFDWCYRHGAEMAEGLHYVAIPEKVYGLVEETWKNEVGAAGKPVWP